MEQPETGGCENHYDNDHLGYCPQGWRRHANPPAGNHSMLAYQGNDYYEKHCDGQKNAYFQPPGQCNSSRSLMTAILLSSPPAQLFFLTPQPSIETGRSVGNQAPCKFRSGIAAPTSIRIGRRGYSSERQHSRLRDVRSRIGSPLQGSFARQAYH